MKVGILTWFFANNYGARAHTYALRKTILELGCDCEFINYLPPNSKKINIRSSIDCVNPKKHPYRVIKCLLRCVKFEIYKKYNVHGRRFYSAKELDGSEYDLIVIGSDAILNVKHPLFSSIYYGVGLKRTHFCTYAPSCEYLDMDFRLPSEYALALSDSISLNVRDRFSRQLVEMETGRESAIVLDPTFLISFSSISKPMPERNYILIYTFSDWEEYASKLKKYARDNNLRIISVGRYVRWADKSYDAASFPMWLGSFTNASIVFTDSYHGTVFAIKNKKPLVTLARNDKRYKISDLLDQLELNEVHFYEGENIAEYLEKSQIDYERVNQLIEEKREYSIQKLKDSIKKANENIKII